MSCAPVLASDHAVDPAHMVAIHEHMRTRGYGTSKGILNPLSITKYFVGNKTVYRISHVQYTGSCELLQFYTDPAEASLDSCRL